MTLCFSPHLGQEQSHYLDIAIQLTAFAVLIGLTAFFVATEFAIVKVRSTRIDQLVAEGRKNALAAKRVTSNLDDYLSACQLGITITALGLGWLGEPVAASVLHPLFESLSIDGQFSSILSFFVAFTIVTFLHVVVGELVPKTAAIQLSEQLTLLFAKPLILFYRMMYPFIKFLNGSAKLLTKSIGLKTVSGAEVSHTEEELRMILSDSLKSGEINQSEYKYVDRIFEFDDRIAKEIMVPRTEITSIEKDMTLIEVFEMVGIEQYTRYPVSSGDKDHIVGLVNMKNLLTAYIKDPKSGHTPVINYMQPIIQVIESMPISDLLLKIQRERIHVAILMDEYGGTSGLVTIEDIIEEIVGDIRDEFDIDERPEVQKLGNGHYIVDAKMLLGNVNSLLGTTFEEEDIDTLGGWVMKEKYEAVQGDKLTAEGYEFKIKEVDGHQIHYLEIIRLDQPSNNEHNEL